MSVNNKNWPTAPGAFASQYNGVTIYRSLPDKPYVVLGKLATEQASDRNLAWSAKSHGADAVIIINARMLSDGSVNFPGNSTTYFNGNTAILLIQSPGFSVPITTVVTTAWLIKLKSENQTRLDDLNLFLQWANGHTNGTPGSRRRWGYSCATRIHGGGNSKKPILLRTAERDAIGCPNIHKYSQQLTTNRLSFDLGVFICRDGLKFVQAVATLFPAVRKFRYAMSCAFISLRDTMASIRPWSSRNSAV